MTLNPAMPTQERFVVATKNAFTNETIYYGKFPSHWRASHVKATRFNSREEALDLIATFSAPYMRIAAIPESQLPPE